MLAKEKRNYHPIKEYLESVKDKEKIDITKLATYFFGKSLNGEKCNKAFYDMLIASVSRIYEPGYKCDNTFVLVGPSPSMKSTFFENLFGKDFFEDLVVLKENNVFLKSAHEHWCCEVDLKYWDNKKENTECFKNFLFRNEDAFKKQNETTVKNYKRPFIFVITCNDYIFFRKVIHDDRFCLMLMNRFPDILEVKKLRDSIWSTALEHYQKRLESTEKKALDT